MYIVCVYSRMMYLDYVVKESNPLKNVRHLSDVLILYVYPERYMITLSAYCTEKDYKLDWSTGVFLQVHHYPMVAIACRSALKNILLTWLLNRQGRFTLLKLVSLKLINREQKILHTNWDAFFKAFSKN